MRLLCSSFLLTGMAAAAFAQGQPQPLQPPSDTPGMAIPNLMMNRTADWPTNFGLPQPQIVRTMAGERWYLIELSRGDFSCGGKCGDNLGNLFTPGTGWVPVTRAHGSQNMYTFNTVPSWATLSGGTNEAPRDIDQENEVCQAPLAGQRRPDGDCIWAEWVTTLMQRNCGVHAQPPQPLQGRCSIHYFEGWNELNTDGFWKDSLAHLVKMDIDADEIIKSYCGDCYFMAGSVTAGGTGWHAKSESGSGQWNVALGQYLDAWHARNPKLNPDIVSVHIYPSREDVNPVPFPETMVSERDSACTAANTPNKSCNQPMVGVPASTAAVIRERKWLNPQTPIWNTESGYTNTSLLLGKVIDPTLGVEVADLATDQARQAWVSRYMILISNSGLAENNWYLFDNQCFGTLYGFSKPPNLPCKVSQPVFRPGLTPQGQAWIQTYRWLHGGRFDGSCSAAHNVWSCRITRADGTPAEIVWLAAGQKTAPYATSYAKAVDLDGKTTDVSGTATISFRPILLYGGKSK